MKTGNFKKNKHFLLIGILPILLIWIIVLFISISTPVVIIVQPDQPISFGVYTDEEINGHTYATAHQTSQGIIFDYELKQGYAFPYAGISFDVKPGTSGIQSNSVFTIELITTGAGKIIPVLLNEPLHYAGKKVIRPVQYELKTETGKHVYHIPLQLFEVPDWWYKNNDPNNDLPAFDPAHVQSVCIQNATLATLNMRDGITIIQISYATDNSSWIWLATAFSGCWIIGSVIYLFIQKKKQTIFIPYIPTESKEEPIDAWEKIRQYVSMNYMHDIDMERMEKDLGIARHKIAVLIKENTTLIFKQYLNKIKVAEAKRLLQETNLPIGEIADKVGFGHLSNFNRVFKQYSGESPSDLRKQVQIK